MSGDIKINILCAIGVVAAIALLIWAIIKPKINWKSLIKNYRTWIVLTAILVIIGIMSRPMYWLGSIGLGWTVVWLILSIGAIIPYVYSYSTKTKSLVKSILAGTLLGVLAVGIISAGVWLGLSSPELTSSEVKTITDYWFKDFFPHVDTKVASAEYRGGGIWKVKIITSGGVFYIPYDENSNEVKFGQTIE